MKKWIINILLMLVMMCGIIGCGDDVDEEEIKLQPINGSYAIEELAAMEPDERKELCENKHIEVSGIAEKAGMSFELGSKKKDGIYVSCAFSNYNDEVSAIEEGDFVTLHGACTSSLSDGLFMFECELSEIVEETTKEILVVEEESIGEETALTNLPIIVEEPKAEEKVEDAVVEEKEAVAVVDKSESVVEKKEEPALEPTPAPQPEPSPAPQPEPSLASQPEPSPAPQPEPSPTSQQQSSSGAYAVNGKNGKIHIVGQCPATGNGDNAMDIPVYFNTYEEAEAYSIQNHSGQKKRQCGNCW